MTASRLEILAPGLFRWAAFSPGHKVELASHAAVVDDRLYCFDPIPLVDEEFQRLSIFGKPAAIILTNGNHERDAARWRELWQVPICAAHDADLSLESVERFPAGASQWECWKLWSLDGGGAGELAFRWPERSLVVFGDAVIHLPGRALELLPEKYCQDRKRMERHLKGMLADPFQTAVVAHGTPLMSGASRAIARLLGGLQSEAGGSPRARSGK